MESPARGDLLALLATISDPRRRKGRRHQLPAMLAAIVCGILAGAQGCTAIAQWIHEQEASFWHQLGFLRKPPTTNGFRYLLLKLPPETLESVIGQSKGATHIAVAAMREFCMIAVVRFAFSEMSAASCFEKRAVLC